MSCLNPGEDFSLFLFFFVFINGNLIKCVFRAFHIHDLAHSQKNHFFVK